MRDAGGEDPTPGAPSPPAQPRDGARPRRSALSIAWKVAAVAIAIAVIVWANQVAVENDELLAAIARFGYPGLFVVSAISGFNLLIPIPAISLFPLLMEAGFHPVVTVLVIGAGMTVGDSVGFLLGRLGRKVVTRRAWLERLERMRERHAIAPYVLMFFWAAFAPVPNEVLVIPLDDDFDRFLARGFGAIRAAVATSRIAAQVMFDTLTDAASTLNDETRKASLRREGEQLVAQAREHLTGPELQLVEARYVGFATAMA